MGIDPAYGSRAFGIVIMQFVDGRSKSYMQRNTKGQTLTRCYQGYGTCLLNIQDKKC